MSRNAGHRILHGTNNPMSTISETKMAGRAAKPTESIEPLAIGDVGSWVGEAEGAGAAVGEVVGRGTRRASWVAALAARVAGVAQLQASVTKHRNSRALTIVERIVGGHLLVREDALATRVVFLLGDQALQF